MNVSLIQNQQIYHCEAGVSHFKGQSASTNFTAAVTILYAENLTFLASQSQDFSLTNAESQTRKTFVFPPLILERWIVRPRSHCSVLVMILFVAWKLPVHITSFLYRNGEKNIRFCAFTLVCLITNTILKISAFVRSHCSSFVKLNAKYWNVFKDLRFCAFTLIFKTSLFVDVHFR